MDYLKNRQHALNHIKWIVKNAFLILIHSALIMIIFHTSTLPE